MSEQRTANSKRQIQEAEGFFCFLFSVYCSPPRSRSKRGFTPSLKFALGGPHRVLFALRTFITHLRDGFHISPRQGGMPLPAKANSSAGFTLVETLVAVSILTVAIVAPMALTAKSLATAYYARDQIIAFHLGQEAIEAIRHRRDSNILINVFGNSTDLLDGIPATDGSPFIVDTRDDSMSLCPLEGCPPLQWSGELYGYRPGCQMPTIDCGAGEGWENTGFTRTVKATFVGAGTDEVLIAVEILWRTGAFQTRSFTISDNLYRWLEEI